MNKNTTDMDDMARLLAQITERARASGYVINPDKSFTEELVRGLYENGVRYGYRSCPCRLASGNEDEDRDIICPCSYRDQDLAEFGACYCALYVSSFVANGERGVGPIPERRPPKEFRTVGEHTLTVSINGPLSHPVWRCGVCGYLCARNAPPETCPVCHAERLRFERFI